jgi:hypothetical protein
MQKESEMMTYGSTEEDYGHRTMWHHTFLMDSGMLPSTSAKMLDLISGSGLPTQLPPV